MVDDKKATDDLVKEPKAKKSKPEPVSDAPTTDAPITDTPVSDEPTPAGTDQQGRQLYSVKCSKCGKQTEVPFKPSGDRPVYCRDCYMQQRQGGGRRF